MAHNRFTHFWLLLALLIFQAQSVFANVPCTMMSSQSSAQSHTSHASLMDGASGMDRMSGMNHAMHQMPSAGPSDVMDQAPLDCCGESGCAMASCFVSIAAASDAMHSVIAISFAVPDLYDFSYSSLDFSPASRPPIRY